MRFLIPVLAKSLSFFKAQNPNLVEKKVWVKPTNGRKGHYRMQWTLPGRPGAKEGASQIDLFGDDAPVSNPEPKKIETTKDASGKFDPSAHEKKIKEMAKKINETPLTVEQKQKRLDELKRQMVNGEGWGPEGVHMKADIDRLEKEIAQAKKPEAKPQEKPENQENAGPYDWFKKDSPEDYKKMVNAIKASLKKSPGDIHAARSAGVSALNHVALPNVRYGLVEEEIKKHDLEKPAEAKTTKMGIPNNAVRGSEMGNALGVIGKINRPYLNQFPSGKWGFVGSVPHQLSYRHQSGRDVTDEEIKGIRSFGKGAFPQIKTRVWDTPEAAMDAAKELGFIADNHDEARTAGLRMKKSMDTPADRLRERGLMK